jgi:hypothetical protein
MGQRCSNGTPKIARIAKIARIVDWHPNGIASLAKTAKIVEIARQ